MKLLAIESACAACSSAVWVDGMAAASRFAAMERGQAEALMPMVQQVMAESGVTFDALDGVAVTIGPGSFTGLRTGLAAARGLALARGLPVLGVTTLEAVALAARRAAADRTACPVTVALDSRRAAVFAQNFDAGLSPMAQPYSAPPDRIAAALPEGDMLLAGDAADRVRAVAAMPERIEVVAAARMPDAVCVAELAAAKWAAGIATPAELAAAPLYLSPPEAKRPADGGRLRP